MKCDDYTFGWLVVDRSRGDSAGRCPNCGEYGRIRREIRHALWDLNARFICPHCKETVETIHEEC